VDRYKICRISMVISKVRKAVWDNYIRRVGRRFKIQQTKVEKEKSKEGVM